MRNYYQLGIGMLFLVLNTFCYANPPNNDAIRSISIKKNSVFPAGAKIVALGENEFYILGKNETLHLKQPIKRALDHQIKPNYKEVIKYSTYNGKKVKMISYVAQNSPKSLK